MSIRDAAPDEPQSLLRALGPGMAMAMVVGSTIGSGIFFKPARIAQETGSFPMIMGAWLLGGIVCSCGALTMAELGAMMPRAGGLYVYLKEAYGRLPAFLYGWCEFMFNGPAANGALAVAAVTTFATLAGWSPDVWSNAVAASGVIVLFAAINIVGVIWGGSMQALTTVLKVASLALIALLPWGMSLTADSAVAVANFTTEAIPSDSDGIARFVAAMLAVMWAYNGWEGVTPVAEEIRDPQKNIPLALGGGLLVLTIVYCTVNLGYHSVLSVPELAALRAVDGNEKSAAVALIEKQFAFTGETGVRVGQLAISTVILISALGAICSGLLYSPRVAFAMGRDRLFFPILGRAHARFRTPAAAIATQAGMAVFMIVLSALGSAFIPLLKDKSVFHILTDYIVFSASCFLALAVTAVFVLRRRLPEAERPYRTWGYPFVPGFYIVFYLVFLGLVFQGNPVESLAGFGLMALGLPVFALFRRSSGPVATDALAK